MKKTLANMSLAERQAYDAKQLERQRRLAISDIVTGKVKNWEEFERTSGFYVQDKSKEFSRENVLVLFNAPAPAPPKVESAPVLPIEDEDADEYSIIPSLRNNPRVRHIPFQERETSKALRAFMRDNHYAHAISGGVGIGKTYIIGALIRELWSRNWKPLVESMSPYPVLYVTRSSIVTQTKRVLLNDFGLKEFRQVLVTNIEKLRGQFGEKFLRQEIEVRDGIEQVVFKWYPFLTPALVVLDEAHAVKNIDSTQSRIFQALNDLPGEHYQLHTSATLWMRVVDAKCFAVATRMKF